MKHTKRITALALCAAILCGAATGCSSSDPTPSASSGGPAADAASTGTGTGSDSAEPVEIRITRPLYFGDVSENQDLKADWPKQMEERYGYKVTVNALARNEYMEKVNTLIASKSVDGLVYMFGSSDVWGYRDQGVIDPVNAYLADNETWKALPEIMQTQYDYEGEVWGIPCGYGRSLFTRTIRQDWLENLNMEVPTTVDELYEVAKAFTFNDPDGNGKDDTYGITAVGTWNLQDFFQAFDCRLDTTGTAAIAYDVHMNQWVDSMLKPEMAECLTFLNKMYQEGVLDKEIFTNKGSNMRDKIQAGEYGSTFYWLGYSGQALPYTKKVDENAKFTEIAYLKGKLTDNINHIWGGGAPYILLKGTPDGDKMVNEFINMTFGTEEQTLFCTQGIPDVNYRLEGDVIYTLLDSAGTPIPGPGIASLTPSIQDKYTILPDGLSDTDKADAIALENYKKSIFESGQKEGGLYFIEEKDITPRSEYYLNVQGDITTAFETAVSSAITGSVPVQQALDAYRQEMKSLGAQQVLDEANEAMGYTGTMQY